MNLNIMEIMKSEQVRSDETELTKLENLFLRKLNSK